MLFFSFSSFAATENFTVSMTIVEGLTVTADRSPADSSNFAIKARPNQNLSITTSENVLQHISSESVKRSSAYSKYNTIQFNSATNVLTVICN